MLRAERVLEAKSLPQGTSAQLVELMALTRALELSKGQQVNIYTDSKCAYLTLHAHAAIWKERQFIYLFKLYYSCCYFILLFFLLCHAACGIFVPPPGTEPMPPALEA